MRLLTSNFTKEMVMNKKLAVLSAAALLAGISGAASASDHVSFSISFGAPAYVAPPAAYYRPPATYYAPRAYYPAPVVAYRGHDRFDRHFSRDGRATFDRRTDQWDHRR